MAIAIRIRNVMWLCVPIKKLTSVIKIEEFLSIISNDYQSDGDLVVIPQIPLL